MSTAMMIFKGVQDFKSSWHGKPRVSVMTVGNFDGVHRGHRILIEQLVRQAKSKNAASIVMTFDPHPAQVLYPERPFDRLFDLKDQEIELAALGVDFFIIEPFSRRFSETSPDRFITDWILRPFSPVQMIVGYDFAFGAHRSGTLEFLKQRAAEVGVVVEVISPYRVDGVVVSSSRIRAALKEGKVHLATQHLGRAYYLKGLIEKGQMRGKKIGVPTANMSVQNKLILKSGVYITTVDIRGCLRLSVTNIGVNPTFIKPVSSDGLPPLKVETHILDFNEDIYGEVLTVHFHEFVRDEKKFSGVENLVSQIRDDIQRARQWQP